MRRGDRLARWQGGPDWVAPLVTGLLVSFLAVDPSTLLPMVRAYQALCERYPPLALEILHAPILPLAFMGSLTGLCVIAGSWAGITGLVRTLRFNQRLQRSGRPMPPRLASLGRELGIADRLTYLDQAKPAACCHGFIWPRVAVTAGLVARLDDEELTAVLAHERAHLRRRDPLRYLALHALTTTAFLFPIAPTLRQRREARIELAADRAALAVASRGALAGALLVGLGTANVSVPGVAGLTATEARITHLTGTVQLPALSVRRLATSLSLVVVIILTMVDLALGSDVVRMVCQL